jgi:hypothetical protein
MQVSSHYAVTIALEIFHPYAIQTSAISILNFEDPKEPQFYQHCQLPK